MMVYYLLRLDDACPTMDYDKWQHVEQILDIYGVRPMVGIIPNNENPHEIICEARTEFWNIVKSWENKGWAIALHGYNHCYSSNGGLKGLNPMWERSEFAGLPLEEQKEKIRKGVSIMRTHGFNPKYFFAPSHTFDDNTLSALVEESDIRIISDTIANKPYKYRAFTIIPQLGGHCVKMNIPGIWTFCLHPNTMDDKAFQDLSAFLSTESSHFISFQDIDYTTVKSKNLLSRLLSWVYFSYRKLRRS